MSFTTTKVSGGDSDLTSGVQRCSFATFHGQREKGPMLSTRIEGIMIGAHIIVIGM